MKKLLIFLLLNSQNVIAQTNILSTLPKQGKTAEEFIPASYESLNTVEGDLNKDGMADVVIVANKRDEKNASADKKPARLLIILFKNKTGYELSIASDKAIMKANSGGAMGNGFDNITIENSVLTIEHAGGSSSRWSSTHKFRYQNNDFYLIGKHSISADANKFCESLDDNANLDDEDINYITGDYIHKKISSNCKLITNVKKKVSKKPLQKLSSFNINK